MIPESVLNVKSLLWRAHAQGIRDGFLPFWAAMLGEVLTPLAPESRVVEFGSTGPDFLRLAYLAFPYAVGLGIVLDVERREGFELWGVPGGPPCRFVAESAAGAEPGIFDLAFSHEVLGLLPDIGEHARAVWRLLGPEGVYYAAFVWHGDNPHSKKQAVLRADQGLPFYPHGLTAVADAFHGVGFEVGFKRLQPAYFLGYDPALTARRFGGVAEMIGCLQDQKVLFSFRKGGDRHGRS